MVTTLFEEFVDELVLLHHRHVIGEARMQLHRVGKILLLPSLPAPLLQRSDLAPKKICPTISIVRPTAQRLKIRSRARPNLSSWGPTSLQRATLDLLGPRDTVAWEVLLFNPVPFASPFEILLMKGAFKVHLPHASSRDPSHATSKGISPSICAA